MHPKIAHYHILETISENGPISVYKARHNVLKRTTLLKLHKSNDEKFIKRFEQEAQIVAALKSPRIASIYDYGTTDNNQFYISMEYVEGGNLSDYLAKNTLNINEKMQLCYHITMALQVLHNKGYVHRDLKPENLLVTAKGEVKLTDFGISFHATEERNTPQGTLLGTPLYMSPEQINNTALTQSSDLFALGTIFYQILTGDNPFKAESFPQIFAKILSHTPPQLHKVDHSIPEWFGQLTSQLIHREVKKRPVNISKVIALFLEHNFGLEEQKQQITQQPSRSFSPWVWASVIILLTFTIWFKMQQPNTVLPSEEEPTSTIPNNITPDSVIKIEKTVHEPNASQIKPQQNTLSTKNENTLPTITKPTRLFFNTNPWCDIYLDYKKLDTTPLNDTINIKPGVYILGLQNPNFPSWEDTITISAGKTHIFNYNLDSLYYTLNLIVHPWGEVYIDDVHMGTTPLQKGLQIKRNSKTIRIENKYYITHVDSLRWPGNKRVSKSITLTKKSGTE